MNAAELEQYLTQFLQSCRDSKRRFEEATALEQYPNDATQDLLHAIELAPSQMEGVNLVRVIHDLRVQRRDAKKELEVTQIFFDWATQNKKAIDQLDNALGQMRKILRRQPHDAYRWRTSIIGEAGNWLQADPEPEPEMEDVINGDS